MHVSSSICECFHTRTFQAIWYMYIVHVLYTLGIDSKVEANFKSQMYLKPYNVVQQASWLLNRPCTWSREYDAVCLTAIKVVLIQCTRGRFCHSTAV